jgi:hypothetical protein
MILESENAELKRDYEAQLTALKSAAASTDELSRKADTNTSGEERHATPVSEGKGTRGMRP